MSFLNPRYWTMLAILLMIIPFSSQLQNMKISLTGRAHLDF